MCGICGSVALDAGPPGAEGVRAMVDLHLHGEQDLGLPPCSLMSILIFVERRRKR
jgi:hypothetical protein